MDIIQDDMCFKPYAYGGYQCLIETKVGRISVRFGSNSLFTDNVGKYEVYYPTEDAPDGYQTSDDIFNYIKAHSKK